MTSPHQRSFHCHSCQGIIYIPLNLPPTYAPCPHCGVPVTSPPPSAEGEMFAKIPSPEPAAISPPATVLPQERTSSAPEQAVQNSKKPATRNSSAPLIVAVLLVAVILGGGWLLMREYNYLKTTATTTSVNTAGTNAGKNQEEEVVAKNKYYQEGWKVDAEATLHGFLNAKTPEEKAKYAIGGMATFERLYSQYGDKIMTESLKSAETFYPVNVRDESEKTQIFLMTHHRPSQLSMKKFFRPLISSEMLHGIVEIDPLTESLSNVENFSMPRLTVQAYFKKTEQGMFLDWDVYAQTRFQALKQFMDKPHDGATGEFRVLLFREISAVRDKNDAEYFYYRVCDPAHIEDNFLIKQRRESPELSELSKLHTIDPITQNAKVETATVVLEQNAGETHIKKFVCWEFAGLGVGAAKLNVPEASDNAAQPQR